MIGNRLAPDAERSGHAKLEPVSRVAQPLDTTRIGQSHDRHFAFTQGRNLTNPQRASLWVSTFQQVAPRIAAASRRFIRRTIQHHGRRPSPVGLERGSIPRGRVQPRVEFLLQRAEVPPLELSRPVCPINRHLPRWIRDDLLATAIGTFDHKVEDQPRLAGRPGPVADSVVEHLDAQDVLARRQQGRQVDRIGVDASWIAGSGAPLDPPPIDRQQVSAVGRDKARGPTRRAAERHFAAKQQERVRQRPLRRQPDPPRRREVDSPRPPSWRTDGRMKQPIGFLDRQHAVFAASRQRARQRQKQKCNPFSALEHVTITSVRPAGCADHQDRLKNYFRFLATGGMPSRGHHKVAATGQPQPTAGRHVGPNA